MANKEAGSDADAPLGRLADRPFAVMPIWWAHRPKEGAADAAEGGCGPGPSTETAPDQTWAKRSNRNIDRSNAGS